MNKYHKIKSEFEALSDSQNAISMSNYMRNQFNYYGIMTPKRKLVYRDLIKEDKNVGIIDWDLLDLCYADEHREFQYFVYDYLLGLKDYLTYEDIPKIEKYIVTKPWWDTIDILCKLIGHIGQSDKRVKKLMLKWSKSKNLWIRRTAIEHQLFLKEKTDTELLEKIIVNCLGSDEFFIDKAIGWVLRDYGKTNPEWVINFVNRYQDKMSKLSITQAMKYL